MVLTNIMLRKEAKSSPYPCQMTERQRKSKWEKGHDSIYTNMYILEMAKLIISDIKNQDKQVVNLSYMLEMVSGKDH